MQSIPAREQVRGEPADGPRPLPWLRTWAIALVFTAIFTWIDWEKLSSDGFPDLINYKIGFNSGYYLFQVINLKGVYFFLSEGLWIYSFQSLLDLTGDIDEAFYIAAFISVLLCSNYVIRNTRSPIYLLILINPIFIDMVMGQTRSALAAAILYSAIIIKNKIVKTSLLLVSISFHTSFIVFTAIYASYILIEKLLKSHKIENKSAILISGIVLFSFFIVYIQGTALAFIDDRRAASYYGQTSGWLFFVGWASFIVSYFLLSKKPFSLSFYFYAFCVSLLFFCNVFEVYGSRYVAVAVPSLAVMIAGLSNQAQRIMFLQYAVFTATYFFIWAT